jgi:hypothetical protein
LLISNLHASYVAAGINLPLPHALDCPLKGYHTIRITIFRCRRNSSKIVSSLVNSINGSINTSVFKIISIIQIMFYCNNDYMNENMHESLKKVHE